MYEDRNPFHPRPRMPKPSDVILQIWENDYGVPSVDPECLILMTLLKLYRVKFTISYGCSPFYHRIPSLCHKNVSIPYNELHWYIKNKLCKENQMWHPRHQKRIKFFKRYFTQSFVDVFLFDSWLESSNYAHAIEPWYINVIPFPFGCKYLVTHRKNILRKYLSLLHEQSPHLFILERYRVANTCLRDFDDMLKHNKHYFYRNKPSSLDALVFSYLTLTLHMPLQKPQLQDIVKSYKRLVDYVNYINRKYYPYVPNVFKYVDPVYTKDEQLMLPHLQH